MWSHIVLGFNSGSAMHYMYVGFGLLNLPHPQFPYLYNGDNNKTSSIGLL